MTPTTKWEQYLSSLMPEAQRNINAAIDADRQDREQFKKAVPFSDQSAVIIGAQGAPGGMNGLASAVG